MNAEIIYRYCNDERTCYTPALIVAYRRHKGNNEITYELKTSKIKKSSKKRNKIQ